MNTKTRLLAAGLTALLLFPQAPVLAAEGDLNAEPAAEIEQANGEEQASGGTQSDSEPELSEEDATEPGEAESPEPETPREDATEEKPEEDEVFLRALEIAANQPKQEEEKEDEKEEEAAPEPGWLVDETGTRYVLEDGSFAEGLTVIDGDLYYFNHETKLMKTSAWDREDGVWRWFGKDGKRKFGWIHDGKYWYWIDTNTETFATGWIRYKGKWYYLDERADRIGQMQCGWRKLGGVWYFLDRTSGAMATGWARISGVWYYFDRPNGYMYDNRWVYDGGEAYYLKPGGAMARGEWLSIGGYDRHFRASDGACTCSGYQVPSGRYRINAEQVKPYMVTSGIFSYISPVRIRRNATRQECIDAYVNRALEYLGTRYVWDYACAPGVGVDCAGLVNQALYAVGMELPYNPWSHYYDPWQDHNAWNMYYDDGFMWVDSSQRQRGDLVFWPGHCAIYLGNDQVIEAYPSRVQICSMWYTPSGSYRTPLGFRRPCP